MKLNLFSDDTRSVAVRRNAIYSVLLKGVGIFVSLLLVPVTLGYVSDELYGIWLAISSILTWLNFFDIGLTNGLKNRLTEALAQGDTEKGKALVSTTYFCMLLIFIPLCLLLIPFVPFVDWVSLLKINPIHLEAVVRSLQWMLVIFAFQMIVNVIIAVVSAFQQVAYTSLFLVISQILSLLTVIAVSHLAVLDLVSLSVLMALIPVVVAFVASCLLFRGRYAAVAPSFRYIRKKYAGDIMNLGYKFFLIQIQVVVLYQSAGILISHIAGPEAVTSYNIAYKYLGVSMILFNMLMAPLWPAYTDAFSKKDFQWMSAVYRRVWNLFLLSAAVTLVMALVSNWVYLFWIAGKAHIEPAMTWMVAIYIIVYCYMQMNCTVVVGVGAISLETLVVVVGMLVHIPMSLFLQRWMGMYSVLFSMIVINLVYAILFGIQAKKIISQKATGIWIR